ncbi:MAG: alpha/beta hydrolase [bacterium]|nr:alpha/beta hydrolase [bacterium]
MPYSEVSTGAKLYYDDIGEGFPVIAIHGWLGTAQTHLARVMDWLSGRGYHVYGPTRRGYGESVPKPRDYPSDFYHRDARDMLAFMDELEIEKAHVLGFSDGGETALVMATMQPARFASVAVWGAIGSFEPSLRPRIQSNYPAHWMDEETRRINHIKDQGAADRLVLNWISAVKQMIDAGGDISLSQAHKISAPLLMMLGDRDTLNPERLGRRFVDHALRGQLVMFNSGHSIHDEQWEAFSKTLGDFLAAADARR